MFPQCLSGCYSSTQKNRMPFSAYTLSSNSVLYFMHTRYYESQRHADIDIMRHIIILAVTTDFCIPFCLLYCVFFIVGNSIPARYVCQAVVKLVCQNFSQEIFLHDRKRNHSISNARKTRKTRPSSTAILIPAPFASGVVLHEHSRPCEN